VWGLGCRDARGGGYLARQDGIEIVEHHPQGLGVERAEPGGRDRTGNPHPTVVGMPMLERYGDRHGHFEFGTHSALLHFQFDPIRAGGILLDLIPDGITGDTCLIHPLSRSAIIIRSMCIT